MRLFINVSNVFQQQNAPPRRQAVKAAAQVKASQIGYFEPPELEEPQEMPQETPQENPEQQAERDYFEEFFGKK